MRGGSWFVIAWLAMSTPARAYHLDDSLRGSSVGNVEGGALGADGWTVTAPTDRIWWSVPTSSSGSIEWTLSNVTNASLFDGDNDVFNLYDAADSAEPIPYRPDFVEDNYKVWVRIRNEPGFYGNQKLTVGVCPDAAISHASSCACGPGFIEEATAGDPTWDGTPQRLRIEWGGGHVRFLRNGGVVNDIDFSATGYAWGPRQMHFSLGSTRSRAVGTSGMPVGAVFSDLVVDTIDGPIAMCPGPPPPMDAGIPDGGTCGGLMAIADTTAASFVPGAFPDATDLNVEADAGNTPTAIVYARFPPVVGTHAALHLHTATSGSASGGSGIACRVDDTSWDESTMTWATRPSVSTACVGVEHAVTPDEEVVFDVSSIFASGAASSFAIVSTNPDGAHYFSREAGGCALGPRLVTDGVAPIDAATTVDAGSDASEIIEDGVSIDASMAHVDAATRGGGLSSGCGCHAHGRGSPLALAALALLLRLYRRGAARRAPRSSRA